MNPNKNTNKSFYLIDIYSDYEKRQEQVCDLLSRICLKHGCLGAGFSNVKRDYVIEMWEHGHPFPTIESYNNILKIKHIKWYIKNKIKIEDKIWNGSFLKGLTLNGEVLRTKTSYSSFKWKNNALIKEALENSPFYGKSYVYHQTYMWKNSPALYLPYDKESLSYLAGFLAGGKVRYTKEGGFVEYHRYLENNFKEFGIPIERRVKRKIFVSPIWPAMFHEKMPNEFHGMWNKVKRPYRAHLYATILYNTYIGNDFKKGLPYLQSIRTVYNKHKTVKNLDTLRMKDKLFDLDYRFKQMVKITYGKEEEQ